MKKCFLLAILFLVSLFSIPVNAEDDGYNIEEITQYKSFITINQNATIDVTEEIHYFFSSPRHGIFWQYPIEYNAYGFKRATSFDLEEVYYYPNYDENAKISEYTESRNMGWIELKIGEADTTISGDYIYVIKYTLQDVGISYFDDYDEVYFNVIGPGWQVPIVDAEAYITSFIEPTERICFTGEEGSTQSDCRWGDTSDGIFLATSNLEPYEALTFAFKYPPDSIEDRSSRIWLSLIISNLGILLPIPVGILLFRKLKKKWKNNPITIIPHYEVPNDLDPLLAAYIYKGKYDFKHMSAAIIWLATKGYLTLEIEGRKTFLNKVDKNIDGQTEYIKDLYNALFIKGPSVDIKNMPTGFITKVHSIFSSVGKEASSLGYIDKARVSKKSMLTILGILGIGLTVFIAFPILMAIAAFGTAIGIIISSLLAIIVGFKVDIKSKDGNKLYYELEGLKMYINTAEKHRIEFHNDPEKFRGVFEKLLPFAMIFGLEKKWAEEFKDLYKDTQPDWYRGNFSTFDSYMIAKSISNLNSGIKTATTKTYGSSSGYRSSGWSSGGSGFGGGGSSGGGGGGSGGGSW